MTDPNSTPAGKSPGAKPNAADEVLAPIEPPVLEGTAEHVAEAPPHAQSARPARRRDPLPLLFGLGIIVLLGAVVYLWRNPLGSASAAIEQHLSELQAQLETVQQRVQTVERRPAPAIPPAPDMAQALAPLQARLAGLEKQLAALEQRPAPKPADLSQATDPAARAQLAELTAKLDTLTRQLDQAHAAEAAALAQTQAQSAGMAGRLEAVTRQQTELANAQTAASAALAARLDAEQQRLTALSAVSGRLDAQDQKVGALATETGKINAIADRAARLARLQAAGAALAAGRPLGDIPNVSGDAAGALARFRSDPPPTEASLRLAFPAAAIAAETASRPDTAQLPFWQAVQTRAEELVTVRRGDTVVIGDPAAGVVARARHALDAGDLAGTVAILKELTGKPAAAFADWLHQAQALLDARAALASLAASA